MAYKDLVKDLAEVALLLTVILLFALSCTDPTTTISTTHERDTVLVIDTVETLRVDTLTLFSVDSIFIYCYEIDHNRDGHTAEYACDNGTVGPRN